MTSLTPHSCYSMLVFISVITLRMVATTTQANIVLVCKSINISFTFKTINLAQSHD